MKFIGLLLKYIPSKTDGLREIHRKMIRLQVYWVAQLGDNKLSFYVKYFLSLLLSPLGYWIAYETNSYEKLMLLEGSDYLIAFFFYFPFAMLPPMVAILTFIIILTGMMFDDFWKAVEVARAEMKKENKGDG